MLFGGIAVIVGDDDCVGQIDRGALGQRFEIDAAGVKGPGAIGRDGKGVADGGGIEARGQRRGCLVAGGDVGQRHICRRRRGGCGREIA